MRISGVYTYSAVFYYVTFNSGDGEYLEKDNPKVLEYLKTHDIQDRKK